MPTPLYLGDIFDQTDPHTNLYIPAVQHNIMIWQWYCFESSSLRTIIGNICVYQQVAMCTDDVVV